MNYKALFKILKLDAQIAYTSKTTFEIDILPSQIQKIKYNFLAPSSVKDLV